MPKFKFFAGNSNPDLASAICEILGIPLSKALVTTFSDGEIRIEIQENVRRQHVLIMQSVCAPVNNNLMELIFMIDACRRSSAKSITAVIPYFGYARSDRKVVSRSPISAKVVASMITGVGASRIITMDLHAGQIQGFFDIPVDNIFSRPVIVNHIKNQFTNNIVIVSPDAGGADRARSFAKKLNAGFAMIDKRREEPNKAEAMNVVGNVAGKRVIIVDDMVDTAGTLVQASKALIEQGAQEVHAFCTHAVLSGPAVERISISPIKTMVVTDTIPLNDSAKSCEKIKILSIADLLAETIKCINTGKSVSSIFE